MKNDRKALWRKSLLAWFAVLMASVALASVPAFDVEIPGSGYDASKPDCGMSAARVFDSLQASRIGTLVPRMAKDLPETSCTSVGFEGLDRKLFDPTDDVYDKLAACGVKRARVQTMWSRCETQKGVHDFSALDEVIDKLRAKGIVPWFSVTFGNTLYMNGCRTAAAVGNVPLYYGDECRAAWLAYVRALARHYRGKVTEWEIWNEPNCGNFWQPRGPNAADYAELVKITGEAIRAEIPDAKIGGTTASSNLLDWERAFFKCGGAKHIDFWSFHTYGVFPEGIRQKSGVRDFVEEYANVRAFIDSHGGGHVRIWQGESGFPSWFHKDHWLFPKGVCQQGWQSQANQAKWLLRRFVTDRRAGIDVSSFYQACDIVRRYSMAMTTRPHPAEHGLLNGWTHEPKMSYRAMGNYNAFLADATYDATCVARVSPAKDADVTTVVAGFRTASGHDAYVYYAPFDFSGSYTGRVYQARTDAKLTLPKTAALVRPVLVDLLRGGIYDVKGGTVCGDAVEYADLPLVDYPLVLTDLDALSKVFAACTRKLSTGVEIPDEGVPSNNGWHQYTTRMEARPAAITNEAQYLKWKWRMNLADPKTGLDNDGLIEGVKKIAAESGWREGREDWYDVSARMFDFLVDNVQIGFSKYDCFPAISAWDRHARPSGSILWSHAAEVDKKYAPNLRAEIDKMRREGRASIGKDFDHSAPDWDDIFKIGFPGMKARVDAIDKDTPFYRAEKRTAAAMMRFLGRLVATAKAHPEANSPMMRLEIESLERLRQGPPQTCFDLMEFTMVYFILSEPLNYFQVRTMGNIDRLWLPYYERDLAAGRTTEAQFREQFRHFIWQFGSIDNYWGHPIYLGGVNLDGRSAYNALSPILLDVVDKESLPTPKFQLKLGPDTPDAIWNQALDMVRRHRSLVLMSEPNMMESMKAVGLPDDEAKDLLIWGCFEYLPRARGNCTSASRINLPQPVVEILRLAAKCNADLPTFADFKREYLRILTNNAVHVAALLNENERHLAECNPSLMLSLAVPSALERGVDAFSLGYDYNYTTISMNGFGTAVDSLLAVKEFVYDRREVTLAELGKAIVADWKGCEALQLKAKRSTYKWGCGNPEADALAKEVAETFTGSFVGKPNARGGKFVCYGLTSRGFIEGAKQLDSATPDGRNRADHFSKNIAPAVGSETEGVSGSIRSMGALSPRNFPCGAIYDIVIHPSMVSGEKGLFAFRKIVERYFAGGGIAMNINIVSPELLRDAQAHPGQYENLQVRVAGWNIRWNDIPKKEQDEYIRRAECIQP